MQKLKQKFAHRARVGTDSRVIDTSSPPDGRPESSTQPSIEVTSSPSNPEATGAGGGAVSNTEHDRPWGLKLLYEGIEPIVDRKDLEIEAFLFRYLYLPYHDSGFAITDTPGAASASAACETMFYLILGYVEQRAWRIEILYPFDVGHRQWYLAGWRYAIHRTAVILACIVALHGLNGHREKTWTFEGKGKSRDILWLRDLLPSIIPNARIWTWGYDSRTRSKSHGEQLTIKSLYDHGRELVFDLDGERRASNSHRRPIIFIVHSLGGIVVKSVSLRDPGVIDFALTQGNAIQALLHSDRVREGNLEEQRSIKISTYGIIFMGTPHQGGQGVGIGKIMLNIAKAQGHTSDNLLKQLEVHSELLQQQLSEFTLICQEFEMYFAYETKPTPIVGSVAMVIVPKWSAVVPGTPNTAEFGISEDHRRMTKFSNIENADFKKIVRILTSMMQNADTKVKSNWSVEALKKRAALGAKTFEMPFDIRGVPIVNRYVERDREMFAIESFLRPGVASTQRRVVVLHGLGGTGKTQLSLAYARKHRADHTAIVWLNGQTQDSLKQSIAGFARSLPANQLPESAQDKLRQGSEELGKLIDEVLKWFGKLGNTQWLLIYDNVDRDAPDEAHDPEAYDVRKYFPNSDHGSIIITTRRLQLRHLGDELKVNTMTTEEGMELLRNSLGDLRDDISSATTLVNRLGALPLALAQAAAYIRETNSRIAGYLVSYDTAWDDLMRDESHPDFAPREYDYRSVYTTWNVSFECVKQKNEDAANMLLLWSILDNKDVWYGLFNNEQNKNLGCWSSLPQWFERVMGKEVDFRRAARILLAYSLIEAKEDSDAFAIHPVVHDWCRETLDASKRHEFMWLAITVVGFAEPEKTERRYWEIELRLLPHTTRCIALLDSIVKRSLQSDGLLDLNAAVRGLGNILQNQSKLVEAEAVYQWALESDEVDPYPFSTARIHHSLGVLYKLQGKLDEACSMFQRALAGFGGLSSSDTHDKMAIINSLGDAYKEQGKLAEAEAMHKRALAWRTDTLGSDHLDTLDTVSNLALVYLGQGKLAEAESSLEWALVVRENKLGLNHPSTLKTVFSLGLCYDDEEKFVEAEAQFERALSGCETVFGLDDPNTLSVCYRLGMVLFAQEKFVEAEVRFRRAISGHKNNKDYEWRKNATAMLSQIYMKQGRLAEAEAIWRQLLAEYEVILGPDHALTLDACSRRGSRLEDNGRLLEAEAMYQRALSGYKEVLGMDHISTLNTLYDFGLLLKRQKKIHEAEDIFQQALSGFKKIRGSDHRDTTDTAQCLIQIYEEQGRLAEAEAMWRQLLAEYEVILGPDHGLTLDVSFKMGRILMDQDDEEKLFEAQAMFQRALSGYKKVLGMDHETTVLTFYNLGTVLKNQRKLYEAEDIFQEALSGFKKLEGHEWTKLAAKTAKRLSQIYEEQGRHEEAEAILQSIS